VNLDKFINNINNWDQKVLLKYNGVGGKYFTYIMKFFSFFGRETIWFFIIAFFIFIWYDPVPLVYIGAAFMNGLILIVPIKEYIDRERPFDKLENKIKILERKPTSKSFPSWHAYNVSSQALVFGLLFKSTTILFIGLTFAVIVSFSRIQLGVHYPSDVIFGFALGIIGFLLAFFFFAPLFLWIIFYSEQYAVYEIYYQEINGMLYSNIQIWYITLCVAIFGGIILSSIYKMLGEHLKSK